MRDCACLRLPQYLEVGSYPSLANQPSTLATYQGSRCSGGGDKVASCPLSSVSHRDLTGSCFSTEPSSQRLACIDFSLGVFKRCKDMYMDLDFLNPKT